MTVYVVVLLPANEYVGIRATREEADILADWWEKQGAQCARVLEQELPALHTVES